MDSLAGFSTEVSLLPWIWIIDYLANFKEVDISILRDLIEMAPGIPDDFKATSERVAFRCLEDLFSDKYNDDVLSATETKIGFATSENCENVLQKILQETSATDLKMAGPELLKWDVGPFLLHKREAMPKCALEQLKDALDASLKESSGVMCGIECNTADVGDLNHSALTMSEKDNSLSSNCENRAGKTGDDLHITNVLPSKRGRDDMAVGCIEGCTNEVQEECDPDNNAKKHKRDAIDNHKPADQISVPTCDKEMVEPVSGTDAAVAGGEGSHIANQSHDEGLEERQFPQDDCDNCDDFRKLDQTGDATDVPIQQNQAGDGENVDGVPQAEPVQNETMDEANVTEPRTSVGVPSVGTKPQETVDESRDELEHSRGEETLIVNDEYQDEIVEIAVKKYNFLSSQSSLGHHYSLAMSDCTVQNLCLKCNKGGQLLSCSNSTCPLVVHENCLGFPVRNDEKGHFHCPFCVYTLAISEYNEAKKKASVARKELAAFIKLGSECYQREFVNGLHRKDSVPSRSNGDLYVGGQENNKGECSHDVNNHLCQTGGANKKGDKGEELVNECLSERGLEGQPVRTSPDRQPDYAKLADWSRPVTPIDQTDDEGKLQEERVQHASINPPEQLDQGEAEGEVQEEGVERPRINSPKQLDQAEAEGELQEEGVERPRINSPKQLDQAEAEGELQEEGVERPRINSPKQLDQAEAEGELQEEGVQHASNPPEQPVSALNIGGERNSEGAGNNSNLSRPQRKQKRKPNYAYQGPAIPQLRRKKVLWTAKEADMIEKGVRLFATDGDSHNIPWKKILDYGLAAFADGGRTTVDLKDKWRRMCKANPVD